MFDHLVLKYLDDTDYAEWSLLGALKFLAKHIKYSSTDLPAITDSFSYHMRINATSPHIYKSVRRKASSLCTGLSSAMNRPEVQQFVKDQDIKHAKEMYDRTIELSVVDDKTTKGRTSSEDYRAFLKDKEDPNTRKRKRELDTVDSNAPSTNSSPSPCPKCKHKPDRTVSDILDTTNEDLDEDIQIEGNVQPEGNAEPYFNDIINAITTVRQMPNGHYSPMYYRIIDLRSPSQSGEGIRASHLLQRQHLQAIQLHADFTKDATFKPPDHIEKLLDVLEQV